MNFADIIILLVIGFFVVLAVRSLRQKKEKRLFRNLLLLRADELPFLY